MNFNKRLRFDDAYNDNNDDHDDEPQQLENLLDDCGETLSSTLPVPTDDDIVITIPDTNDELDEAELCYIDESDSEEDDESTRSYCLHLVLHGNTIQQISVEHRSVYRRTSHWNKTRIRNGSISYANGEAA